METTQESNLNHANGGIEMEERREPRFQKFEKPGDNVTGRLIKIATQQMVNGPVPRYTVEEGVVRGGAFVPSGEMVAFLGTYMIDSKLKVSDIDHFVIVRYVGTRTDVERNGNKMKEYEVRVSKNKVETSDMPF